MTMRTFVTISLATLVASAICSADTVTLRDGRVMNGTYLGGTSREMRFDLGDHVETLPIDRISTVQFDNPAPPQPASPPQANSRPSNFDRFGGNNNAAPPPAVGVVIPMGTPFTVRMIDSVDSETARLGDTFRASIEDPVVINGQTVIPRGADVTARLVDDKQSGKIAGKTVLTLALTTVSINGHPVDITTGDVQQASSSRGARSAKVIGGTAALGAIIGGIAGGGKGAAIGAGSGAAVGTGAEVLTKGQRVKIPSEARLTFSLSNDLRI